MRAGQAGAAPVTRKLCRCLADTCRSEMLNSYLAITITVRKVTTITARRMLLRVPADGTVVAPLLHHAVEDAE